jgi:hypothetical protein
MSIKREEPVCQQRFLIKPGGGAMPVQMKEPFGGSGPGALPPGPGALPPGAGALPPGPGALTFGPLGSSSAAVPPALPEYPSTWLESVRPPLQFSAAALPPSGPPGFQPTDGSSQRQPAEPQSHPVKHEPVC